jgi:hypothetical protein
MISSSPKKVPQVSPAALFNSNLVDGAQARFRNRLPTANAASPKAPTAA